MLNSKITTIIIEKNQKEVNELKSGLSQLKEISVVGTATSGNKGISLINNFAPQLILINTELQDINGLEFVRVLRNRNIFSEIVFVSDHENLAYETLVLEPLDFWVKPVQQEIKQKMITRLLSKLRKKELLRKMDVYAKSQEIETKKTFRQKKGIVILHLDEIVFFNAELTSTKIMLKNGLTVLVNTGISETLEIINSDDFIRISRSNCINKIFLRKIDKRNLKCLMYYEGKTWEVAASKNTIGQLEKLIVFPIY